MQAEHRHRDHPVALGPEQAGEVEDGRRRRQRAGAHEVDGADQRDHDPTTATAARASNGHSSRHAEPSPRRGERERDHRRDQAGEAELRVVGGGDRRERDRHLATPGSEPAQVTGEDPGGEQRQQVALGQELVLRGVRQPLVADDRHRHDAERDHRHVQRQPRRARRGRRAPAARQTASSAAAERQVARIVNARRRVVGEREDRPERVREQGRVLGREVDARRAPVGDRGEVAEDPGQVADEVNGIASARLAPVNAAGSRKQTVDQRRRSRPRPGGGAARRPRRRASPAAHGRVSRRRARARAPRRRAPRSRRAP